MNIIRLIVVNRICAVIYHIVGNKSGEIRIEQFFKLKKNLKNRHAPQNSTKMPHRIPLQKNAENAAISRGVKNIFNMLSKFHGA